jgi:hypothetical protein
MARVVGECADVVVGYEHGDGVRLRVRPSAMRWGLIDAFSGGCQLLGSSSAETVSKSGSKSGSGD